MNILPVIICLCLALTTVNFACATTLSDSLVKRFKTISYPEQDVIARINLQTTIPSVRGGKVGDAVLLAYKLQSKLVATFNKAGWLHDDQVQIDPIDAGLIEIKPEEGLNLQHKPRLQFKAYVYQCDMPMHKYRGENLKNFFEKQVLKKAEQCFTYDQRLQGENYPY